MISACFAPGNPAPFRPYDDPGGRGLGSRRYYPPKSGFRLTNSAAEALKLCEQQQFDLLLTNYNMPGADGVSLVKQVRQQWPRTLAIMITAHDNQELRRLATAAAVDHVLDKRVKIAEIQQVVQRTLQ